MAAANGKSPLILVADKERGSREAVQRAFEEEGYEVVCATDGQRALELAVDPQELFTEVQAALGHD